MRFLSISANNLDEFFMVRVAGLKAHQTLGVEEVSPEGMTVAQQLAAITVEADRLVTSQHEVWGELQAQLDQAGMHVVGDEPLDEEAEALARPAFPRADLSGSDAAGDRSGASLPVHPQQGPEPHLRAQEGEDQRPRADHGARDAAAVHPHSRRDWPLHRAGNPDPPQDRLSVSRNMKCFAAAPSAIIRDSDIEVEEEAEDLALYFRTAIKRRRRGRVVRLELEPGMPESLVNEVKEGLGAATAITSETRGFLGMTDLSQLVEEDRPDLKFPPFNPRFPERIREHGGDCFAAIKEKDILVHHPYESFEVVVEFIQQAAADPDVVAIKQTLYRAGKQSAIIRALIDAAEAGKSVTAVIELKARFDEEQNLMWANALERAGVQVVYGFIEWKTHAKVSMVVRREEKGFRTYCHFGTGNYHPVARAHLHRPQLLHGRTRRSAAMRRSCSITSPAILSRGTSSSWSSRRRRCGPS